MLAVGSLLVSGWSGPSVPRTRRDVILAGFGAGAAALDLAYVAAGRLDGFWEFGLKPWDMAAGALLIREAGGLVSDVSGDQGFIESGNLVTANPHLFEDLRKIVARSGL